MFNKVLVFRLLLVGCLLLDGCRSWFLPDQTGCANHTTRCSPSGTPEVCITGAWTKAPTAQPCSATGRTCCLAASYAEGNPPLHACVNHTACLPEDAATAAPDAAQDH